MKTTKNISKKEDKVKTYFFRVVVEPDENRWHAYCPALERLGAATLGETREEALKHIKEVVRMIVSELTEDGEPLPEDVQVSAELLVSVTVNP